MTILLTRAQEPSERFAADIRARFRDAAEICIAPLMAVDFSGVKMSLDGIEGVILTSRNAVEALVRAGVKRDLPCYAVGTATAEAAREAGFQATSAGGSADDLVDMLVGAGVKAPLLHLRGEETRGDVAKRLNRAGLATLETVCYRQRPVDLSQKARELLRGDAPVIVPLFSPQSAARFAAAHQGGAPLFLAAMSEAVAERLHALPAQRLVVADRPDAAAMLDVLGGLIDAAGGLGR